MPIIQSNGKPRAFAFDSCPRSDVIARVSTRDTAPDPAHPRRPDPAFLASMGLAGERLAWCDQVHGARILASTAPGAQGTGDAMVTDRAGLTLSIATADCAPIFLVDVDSGALGLVHAGWRGAAAGLPGHAVGAMSRLYGSRPDRLWAEIGPAIGPEVYEVGADVAGAFTDDHLTPHGDRWRLDLPGAVRDDLIAAGVDAGRIELSGQCTYSRADLFFSYRREQTSSRIFSVLGRERTRS